MITLSKELKTFLFILTGICFFVFGYNFLKGRSFLQKQIILYATYPQIEGLVPGAKVSLNGLTIGRKVNQKAQLPEFVNNCPKPILREFLGAMFGGDGHTCFLGLHRGKRDILSSVGFSQSKTEENVKSLNDMMDQIKELLSKFDINTLSTEE